jgi:Phage protein Gp138 N-terminal domain
MPPIEVTLPMVLSDFHEGQMQDVHTAVPGQIVDWDASTQTATVQPMIRKPLRSTDAITVYEKPPQIKNVPCYVMRGGGYLVSVPFAAGDPVWLMFSEQSYSEYLATGQLASPKDLRRHGTGYPFAMPGPAPDAAALQSVASDKLVIGKDGDDAALLEISAGLICAGATGTQFVALENLVHAELSKIASALTSVAVFVSGGSTVTGPNTYTSPGSVASSNLKAKP